MATQLRSTRQLSIAGETLDWTEIDPYVWELAFPGGPVIGQIIEIPAHGRTKQTWQRQDTGDKYTSVIVACSDLLTAYYRKQAQQPAPAPQPIEPEERLSTAPVLTIVPKAERPTGVPEGWLPRARAAVAYNVPVRVLEQWIAENTIEHVTAGTAIYVPPPAPTPEPQPEPEQTGRWVSVADAAAQFGITTTTVRERITTGQLPGRKVHPPGKRWQWEVLIPDAPEPVAEQPALIPEPEPDTLRPDDPRCADPDGLARIQTQLAQFEDQVAEEVRAAQEATWRATHPASPPPGWIKGQRAASIAYEVSEETIRRRTRSQTPIIQRVKVGRAWYYAPPGTPAPAQSEPKAVSEPPATGPLPEVAPLSEFASPTIEVQHTPPSDDHPLDETPLISGDNWKLLAAMQRIGYLEAQLEHWQEIAAQRGQEFDRLRDLNNELLTRIDELQRKPRRWFGR